MDDREGAREREYYRRAGGFKLENAHSRIMSLALTPSEESVYAATHDNQLLSVPLSQAVMSAGDAGTAGGDVDGAGSGGDASGIQPAAQFFHSSPVVGLDTCLRKPLVATCSADRSVRVWNYIDRSIDLQKQFPEEVTKATHLIYLPPARPPCQSSAPDAVRGCLSVCLTGSPVVCERARTSIRRSPSPSTPPGCTCSSASLTSCG